MINSIIKFFWFDFVYVFVVFLFWSGYRRFLSFICMMEFYKEWSLRVEEREFGWYIGCFYFLFRSMKNKNLWFVCLWFFLCFYVFFYLIFFGEFEICVVGVDVIIMVMVLFRGCICLWDCGYCNVFVINLGRFLISFFLVNC